MSTPEDQPKHEHRPAGIGPGERLQAARIQQGLSIEDVASRMHLSTNILESIEDNNFDEITAPIFVKGYLRAYARIVSLDEDEMIRQYLEFYSDEDPPIASTSSMAPELSVGDARIKWTTYLVIVILAALLAAWWWNKQQTQDAPISLDAQPQVNASAEVDSSSVVSEIEAVSEQLDSASPGQAENLPGLAAADPAPVPAAAVEPAPVAATPEPPAPPEPAMTVAEDETTAQAAPLEGTTDVGTVVEGGIIIAQIAPSGTDRLQVIVHADSWVDVKDATGFQLAYDLLRANRSLELVGEAPFSVFLGNGHGVELQFNGEDVDVAPRVRDDNTARLKIGS